MGLFCGIGGGTVKNLECQGWGRDKKTSGKRRKGTDNRKKGKVQPGRGERGAGLANWGGEKKKKKRPRKMEKVFNIAGREGPFLIMV